MGKKSFLLLTSYLQLLKSDLLTSYLLLPLTSYLLLPTSFISDLGLLVADFGFRIYLR